MPMQTLLLSAAIAVVSDPPPPYPYQPNWGSVTQHPTPVWFGKARFGFYAHWGVYSVPAYGSEWYSHYMYVNGSDMNKHHVSTYGPNFGYKDFIPMFTAERFNATEWAELYQAAGGHYAGPVAEHADGFAMWRSSVSHYNAAEMGPKRDVVQEVVDAVRKTGLKTVTTFHHQWLWGWYPTYNNLTDTSDPQYQLTKNHGGLYGPLTKGPSDFQNPQPNQEFDMYFLSKVNEVVDQYNPDLIYFDSRFGSIDAQSRLAFLAHYYNVAAEKGLGGVVTYKNKDLEVGAGTIDFERGGTGTIVEPVWQTDDSMERSSWSWVNPPDLKNATELIGELTDVVSKNGNLLLNIPPHADGSIDPRVKSVMLEIGGWMKINGPAIYNSKPWTTFGEGPTKIVPGGFHEWPIFTPRDFRFTVVGPSSLFVFAYDWADEYIVTSLNTSAKLAAPITSVSLLGGSPGGLSWSQRADGLHLSLAQKPATVHLSHVFHLTLGGSKLGFLSWAPTGVPSCAVPGSDVELKWDSASGSTQEAVAIEYAAGGGAWRMIASRTANAGTFVWRVPPTAVTTRAFLRVRSVDEAVHLADVAELRLSTTC